MFQQHSESDELQSISWNATSTSPSQVASPQLQPNGSRHPASRPWSSSSSASARLVRVNGLGSLRATPMTNVSKNSFDSSESMSMDVSPGLTVVTAPSERSSSTTNGWTSVESMINVPQPLLPSIASSDQESCENSDRQKPASPWDLPELESPVESPSPFTLQQVLQPDNDLRGEPFAPTTVHPSGIPRVNIDPNRKITKQYFAMRWGNKENDLMVRSLRNEIRSIDDEDLSEWSSQFHSAWSTRSPSLW